MILKLFIDIIINVSLGFFTLISTLLPSADIDLATSLATMFSITSQATNFVHFLFGDSLVIIVPMLLTLLGIRFILVPILSFLRGFIRFGS